MCHDNTQVEFGFWSGRIIFGRVMPFGLRKIPIIFSFCSLFPLQIDIFNSNSVYRCVARYRMICLVLRKYVGLVEFKFCSCWIIFSRVISLVLKQFKQFLVATHYLCHSWTFSIEIGNVHVSQKYTGQLQIWFYLNYFQQCYSPCTYVSLRLTIFNKSHILTLQSLQGHPCRIDTFLFYFLNVYFCEIMGRIDVKICFLWGLKQCVYAAASFAANVTA